MTCATKLLQRKSAVVNTFSKIEDYKKLPGGPFNPSLGAQWSQTWGKMATCSLQVSCYNINQQHLVQAVFMYKGRH